ncbi:MAG: hypothetical protein LBV19_05455, partial [Streptococcaceae bacterium]|nr:hypothetical protein [Streptococcaceae bacterium]
MTKFQTHTLSLSGSNYDIGYQLGKTYADIPPLKALHSQGMEGFGSTQVKEATELFNRWCPGLADELKGFAEALKVAPEKIFFYSMTYLLPRCSNIALLPA